MVAAFLHPCAVSSSWPGRLLQRSSELITTQSYTVGLLGVPGPSAPSAILPFRRSFFQPSPLGVVAAASQWQRTYRKETTTSAGGVRVLQISNIQLYKSSFKLATELR